MAGHNPMTAEAHRERHQMLHELFDELLADYFQQGGSLRHPIVDLVMWSHAQTITPVDPRELPGGWYERPLLPADEQIISSLLRPKEGKTNMTTEYEWECPACHELNFDTRRFNVTCAKCGAEYDDLPPDAEPETTGV